MNDLWTVAVIVLAMLVLGFACWRAAGYGYREVKK